MTEAQRMLSSGSEWMHSDYGESFTVDGIKGTFSGLFDGLSKGNEPIASGFDTVAGGSLTVDRGEGWVPKIGQLVFANHIGLEYRVESIGHEPGHYRLTLGPAK
jgi:hypothetical protein